MSPVKKDKFDNTKSCNGVDIYDTTRFFYNEEWRKTINNPGVLKLIQGFPRHKKKSDYHNRGKFKNRNRTHYTSNTNTDITQTAINYFHTSRPNYNSIPTQVQIPCMGRKIGVNAVVTNNDVLVTHSVHSKRFYIPYDNNDRIPSMLILIVTTRNCNVSSNNPTKHDGEIGYNSTIFINSHADTHYFGKNFLIVSSTE